MSSTGLIDFNANYINSDIIDVNQTLTVKNINILELVNNNLMIYQKIFLIYQKIFFDLSGNVINNINNLLENLFIYRVI